jgi:hypothetical protein
VAINTDFGLMGDTSENKKKIDSTNPKEVREANESAPSYSDWEMRIFSFEDRAALMDNAKTASQLIKTAISSLLVCLYNARGYEGEYVKFRDRFINLPKPWNFKMTMQGNDYDISELQTNDAIHVTGSGITRGTNLAVEKQANRALHEATILETDLKAFLRRELGYFDERKTFNSNEYIRQQMINTAMPVSPEPPTLPSDELDSELFPERERYRQGGENENVLPKQRRQI